MAATSDPGSTDAPKARRLSGSAGDERPRRGIVQVLYAPTGRFTKYILQPGEEKSFGRDERADVRLPDKHLRGSHFNVMFDGVSFYVRENGSGQLAINGQDASYGAVQSGGFLVAGDVTLRLFLERRSPPPASEAGAGLRASAGATRAHAELSKALEVGALYGLFDAARDPRVLVLLDESVDEAASLYEEGPGPVLDDVAPYLVRFSRDSELLERLLMEGWGKGWGLYVIAREPTKIVRRHFRRFLMVLDDTAHERMFFRFYDPRVMREFLPIATPRQRAEVLFGLERMLVEGEDEAPISFAPSPPQDGDAGEEEPS